MDRDRLKLGPAANSMEREKAAAGAIAAVCSMTVGLLQRDQAQATFQV
jgi:hypothetical protein